MQETLFLNAVLNSWYFRILIALAGAALLAFYGVLLVGAVVNLPASWFGFLYAIVGMAAGVACFVFSFRPRVALLALIIPALVLMLATLMGNRE